MVAENNLLLSLNFMNFDRVQSQYQQNALDSALLGDFSAC